MPPARLRVLVDGHGDPDLFLTQSAEAAAMIRGTLASAGVALDDLRSVLDFGCGCGRTARAWASLGLDLHGCDYNAEPVAWCAEQLPFMQVQRNALEPPAPFPDERFDLVYAISVLTHLTEPLAEQWVAEWTRMLKPGGLLLATTHGDAYRAGLSRRAGPRYDAGEAVVKAGRIQGLNACVAHHPPVYVRTRLLAGLEVLAHVPGDPAGGFRQDAYLARRPPRDETSP